MPSRSLHRRFPWALAALMGLMGSGPGCTKRTSGSRVRMAKQPAAGRPDVCPEDAVDPFGDGTPSPMDLRCSYSDTTGGVLTRVQGRVLLEGAPGSVGESPGRTEVIVYEAPLALGGPLGRAVASATTDPQGAFTLGSMLPAGEYVVVVPGHANGGPLAQRRIVVGGENGHRLDDVRLVIPRAMDPEPEA